MPCLGCAVCWRCHVLIGSTVVRVKICRRKKHEEDRDGGQNQRRNEKSPSTHTYYRYAARYARARKNATETCKGGRKKRPVIIWCEQRSDNAKRCSCRGNCPARCWVLVDSHVLNGSTCGICGEGGGMGTERGQSTEESKKTRTQHVHNGTWYLYHTWYYCCMFNRTHSAARPNTAKRRARHGTALCRAALLSYI